MTEQEQAPAALRALVQHVFDSADTLTSLTYQELAERIGRLTKHGIGHAHGMGGVLGVMGHLLHDLEGEWGESVPHIQSLVVNKRGPLKGLPDDGIKEFWSDYPKLTTKEKLNKVLAEYEKIKAFGSRWDKVLEACGLDPIEPDAEKRPAKISRGETHGESPQHKALKEYVKQHPELVGASAQDEAFIEYALPSLDTLDVLFKGRDRWIAVEVKSIVSDRLEQDYERGIYQCVKYQAILEAMRKDNQYAPSEVINTILVLESKLPNKYRSVADALNIQILENVSVKNLGQRSGIYSG